MKKLNQEEKFVLTILAMVIIALTIITPVRKYVAKLESRIEELEYQLDSVGDNAYEAGYEIGFSEGYESVNPIHNVENWLADVKVADDVIEDGVGTIKLIDGNGDLWVLCYDVE